MILIIQNGSLGTFIQKYLDEESKIIQLAELNSDEIDLNLYSFVIVLGGPQAVSQIILYPDLNKIITFMKKCNQIKKPLLGICLGSHLIAHIMGCTIKKNFYLHMDYDTILTFDGETYSNIFRCHSDYIIPNDNIDVLATFDDKPCLIRSKDKLMVGIQCHPDIPPEHASHFVRLLPTNKSSSKKINDNEIDKENRRLMNKLITMVNKK